MLPDVLQAGLEIVFCGTAVSERSAELRAYYAGRGNKFWSVLAEIELTPHRLTPQEFISLPTYGIGLTDLVKAKAGTDSQLVSADFDVSSLHEKIELYRPRYLCFNGKKSARIGLGKAVEYGLQDEMLFETAVFVAPSTSGAANAYWDKSMWYGLAKLVKNLRKTR